MIGYVPIAGDIAGFVIDMAESKSEVEDSREFITGQFDRLENAMIYSTFDCSVNFVQYDAVDNEQLILYTQSGRKTADIVSNVNDALGTEITEADVVRNPNEITNLIDQLIAENPENEDKYNDAIKGN